VAAPAEGNSLGYMRAYALAEIGERLTVGLLLRREDAFAALEEIRHDEPDWASQLYVAPIELDDGDISPN
jgi:hypothetical protein